MVLKGTYLQQRLIRGTAPQLTEVLGDFCRSRFRPVRSASGWSPVGHDPRSSSERRVRQASRCPARQRGASPEGGPSVCGLATGPRSVRARGLREASRALNPSCVPRATASASGPVTGTHRPHSEFASARRRTNRNVGRAGDYWARGSHRSRGDRSLPRRHTTRRRAT